MPGSGKTSQSAEIVLQLLKRNKKWHEKSGLPRRKVYSNLVLSKPIQERYSEYLVYYTDLTTLSRTVKHADVICQEISQYIDSQEFEKCPRYFKAWLRKHRHYGVDIYADTQDFLTVDVSFRRLVNNVYYCQKIIGSRDDISDTKPAIWFIWGLVMTREIDPTSFDKEKEKYNFKAMSFSFRLITKASCEIYDTSQDVEAPDFPPLKHIIRYCEDVNCPLYKKGHLKHA